MTKFEIHSYSLVRKSALVDIGKELFLRRTNTFLTEILKFRGSYMCRDNFYKSEVLMVTKCDWGDNKITLTQKAYFSKERRKFRKSELKRGILRFCFLEIKVIHSWYGLDL